MDVDFCAEGYVPQKNITDNEKSKKAEIRFSQYLQWFPQL
jgi:hypothetical protein